MYIWLANEETCRLLKEYQKLFPSIPTLSLKSSLEESDFQEMMRKAIETGFPVNKEDLCGGPLPEGYIQ